MVAIEDNEKFYKSSISLCEIVFFANLVCQRKLSARFVKIFLPVIGSSDLGSFVFQFIAFLVTFPNLQRKQFLNGKKVELEGMEEVQGKGLRKIKWGSLKGVGSRL